MANLHRLEDPAKGVLIFQCSDCHWESEPMDSAVAYELKHLCPDDCPDCEGGGRIEGIAMRIPHGVDIEPRYCKSCGGKGKKQ